MPNGKLRCHKGQPVAQDCCTKGSGKEGGGRQTWRKPGGGSVVRLPCPHVVQLAGSQPALETFPGSLEEPAISSRFPRVIASIQAKAVAQGENPGCSQSSCLPKTPLRCWLLLCAHLKWPLEGLFRLASSPALAASPLRAQTPGFLAGRSPVLAQLCSENGGFDSLRRGPGSTAQLRNARGWF